MKFESSLIKMLRAHKESESNMAKVCADLQQKVHTAAAKLLLSEMRLDSLKHEGILQDILNTLEKLPPSPTETALWETRIESFVDMEVIRKELKNHINSEVTMLRDVEAEMRATKDKALKVLLSHMAEDEKRHHKNIELIIHESYSFAP
jgi:rubrerythrin